MIPNVIHKVYSQAEKKLIDLLKELPFGKSWIAFHSLNVSEHQYKEWSELDFVILGPYGLYVLEVKGGRVACKDGIWYFTDRFGVEHRRSEGPFKQAQTGMYALRDRLHKHFSKKKLSPITMGWGVIFPDISFNLTGPEMPAEVICDKKYFCDTKGIHKYIERLADYWRAKKRLSKSSKIDKGLIQEVVRFLRPDFDMVPSLSSRVDDLYREMVQLTEEQYRFIDAIGETERIICRGGAGTGKSFLAIETARHELSEGKNVILTARGEVFLKFLRTRISHPNLLVLSTSEIIERVKSDNFHLYDVLIVDEGQDLMTLEHLSCFDQVVQGGLEKGRWRWFMDANNQAGIYDCYQKDADMLLRSYGTADLRLKRNCRNTEQIVSETELSTGADIGEIMVKGKGPPVIYRRVDGQNDTAEKLAEQLKKWTVEGALLSEIVILGILPLKKSSAAKLPLKWFKLIEVLSCSNILISMPNRLLYSTISDFKGLERKFVAVVDLDCQWHGSDPQLSDLYVSMTRSHAGLWIAVGPLLENYLHDWQASSARELLKKEGR